MKCPKCNTKNPDDSKYCKECATLLKPSKDVSVTKTLQTPTKGFKKDTIIAKKYKIIEKIGEGGMGEVYKAKDTKLDRNVALKFLLSDLIRDKEAKKRFIQEAKAAAALEHPNICTVYEVDEADGQTFIAMSYIEGQSLKDKLKEGPLDIDVAKDIALQVAEGLKEAHEKGIVHRDIKPANIMLTKKGQVKITDFGLAKLSWGVDLTKTSTVMGTVAYMSPEQARGEEVDHRTDIWSLGAVLYEMLSGERPFQKSREQALIYAILNDKPTPLSLLRSDVPTHIEQVIEKALAKKASDRYQNIQELIQEMKLSISFPKAEKSIVVLPFENLSPDPEQEYFCDGMTEEIISDLSKIHSLRVISRTSAMMLKGTRKSMKTITHELDVQYVLEGSVRKAGNNLRITAQLIETASDAHLWAEKYSGILDDVFDIQEKVSRSIADALKLKLSPEESKKISMRPIKDVQAYEFHLRAQYEMLRGTEDGLERALQLLDNGLRIVGDNEILLADKGAVYLWYVNVAVKKEESYLKKAEEYLDKVFAVNPDSPYGHYLKGLLHTRRGNALEAARESKRALDLDPHNTLASLQLAWIYSHSGKAAKARSTLGKLLEIDPLTPLNLMVAGTIEMLEGRFDIALDPFQKAHQMEKANPLFRYWYAKNLAYQHQHEEAFHLFDLISSDTPDTIWARHSLFFSYALQQKKPKALQSVTEEFKRLAREDEMFPIWMAESFALIDETEEALNWLEHGVNWGFIHLAFLDEIDPFLENIRGEPRFMKLMERVKHEWENFEL